MKMFSYPVFTRKAKLSLDSLLEITLFIRECLQHVYDRDEMEDSIVLEELNLHLANSTKYRNYEAELVDYETRGPITDDTEMMALLIDYKFDLETRNH